MEFGNFLNLKDGSCNLDPSFGQVDHIVWDVEKDERPVFQNSGSLRCISARTLIRRRIIWREKEFWTLERENLEKKQAVHFINRRSESNPWLFSKRFDRTVPNLTDIAQSPRSKTSLTSKRSSIWLLITLCSCKCLCIGNKRIPILFCTCQIVLRNILVPCLAKECAGVFILQKAHHQHAELAQPTVSMPTSS